MTESHYPEDFTNFLEFLCEKYGVNRSRIFIEYSSKPPPAVMGTRPGYYDGLLSYRQKNRQVEFLITVFAVAQNPLLTMGHEFAHLVEDLRSGNIGKHLGPPDDAREGKFDDQARLDLNQFWMQKKIDESKRC